MDNHTDKNKDVEEVIEQALKVDSDNGLKIEIIDRLSNDQKALEQAEKHFGKELYSKLIWNLSYKEYDSLDAEIIWNKIVKHKHKLYEKLGRDVGISVASLDYMTNIESKISEARVIEEDKVDEIAEVAIKDELTGLYARSVFNVLLNKAIKEYKRYNTPVSLIMADIDDFKEINDTYGHQKGDDVLKQIGDLFISHARDSDIPARYGGEEFAIILPHTDKLFAYNLSERIRKGVYEKFENSLKVTMSLGISNCPIDGETYEELVKSADKALYIAKEEGKNQVFSKMPED
jgi:diguanylate cyclase (GGDEF)-like protein